MDQQELAMAFKPFGRGGNLYKDAVMGTGLGLPLSEAMMELHGGELILESTKGAGTQATLHFLFEDVRR